MIRKILSRPVTVVMAALAVVIIGLIALANLPLELMPPASFGEISIIYDVRGGIPPDKIEILVVRPVEDAIGDIDNLREIMSISKEGRAIVVLKFAPGTDMDTAVISVRERMTQIRGRLPSEVERPIVAQYKQDDIPIFVIGVTSPVKSAEEIRKIVDDDIVRRLKRIQGVANADVFGGRERKIIIETLPFQMSAFSISMADVINALNRANVSMVAGEAQERASEYQIKATGRFDSIDDIRGMGVAVTEKGSVVRLQDVALIRDSYLEPDSLSRLNTEQNVGIYIQKETLASTIDVADAVKLELDLMRDDLPGELILNIVKNDADYIRNAIDSMKVALIMGAVLSAAVLILFLRNYLLTFIVFLSIPLSVLLAISFLYFNKVTLNVMTLGGLALGVGMLLDNSIVVIENIFRLYKDKNSVKDAICEAVSEVYLPIMAGTVTTVIVFLPIVFLSAELRKVQGDMALAIMYSLLASFFASLTLVPFLYLHLGLKPGADKNESAGIYGFYRKSVDKLLNLKVPIIAGMCVLVVAALMVFRTMHMNLYETDEENKFTVHVELPTGAHLDASDERVKMVEEILMELPEVETLSTTIEKWSSKIYVTLKDGDKRRRGKEEIKEYLRPKFAPIQPAFIYFQESQEMAEKEVFVELYGYDYDKMKELIMEIGGRMQAVEGLEDVKIRMREGRPEKIVVPERRRAAIAGFAISDIAENLHARLRGLIATRFHEDATEIEVIVRQHKPTISNFEQLVRTNLMLPSKAHVQLNQFSDLKDAQGPSEIWRKNRKRMVQVSASRNKISLEGAVNQIVANLENMEFPDNYYYNIGGDYETMLKSRKELFGALILTIVLVYLVLAAVFESYAQPFIIMVAVPMSFIGAVAALMITKSSVSVGVIMGVIMLAGIVVNNAIILVDRVNGLRDSMPLKTAVIEGAAQRLRPILMTTITTILGLLPLALKGGEGSGLWKPLSVTVIGGLTSSTFLVLIGVPCIYILLEDISAFIKKFKNHGKVK